MYESSMYYTLLKENIKNEKKAYIWGAGFFGKAAYELLKALQLNIKLEAFVDRAKQGSYCSVNPIGQKIACHTRKGIRLIPIIAV